jgi:hypothetical protein
MKIDNIVLIFVFRLFETIKKDFDLNGLCKRAWEKTFYCGCNIFIIKVCLGIMVGFAQ